MSSRANSSQPPPPPPPPPPLPQSNFTNYQLPTRLSLTQTITSNSHSFSSDSSNLSASIPVLTKVITIGGESKAQSHEQLDVYNFSQDSLLQYGQQISKSMAHDTPHMTLVSPVAAHRNYEKKERVKRRDQKLRKMLFGNYATLQRQRSLVIKELMVGHGHEGCLMTSQPVQNELKKLLHKTMKGKSIQSKPKKTTSVSKFRSWMTKRQHKGAELMNSPGSSTADLSSFNGSPQELYIEDDADIRSESPITPDHTTSPGQNPKPPPRNHPFNESPVERRIHTKVDSNNESYRVQRRSSIRRSSKRHSKKDTSFQRGNSQGSNIRTSYSSRHDKQHSMSRAHQNTDSTGKSVKGCNFERRQSERIHPTHRQVGNTRSSISFTDDSGDDDCSLPLSLNEGTVRPKSRLERVCKAWQEDEIYSLNPFDSWRLRHQDKVPSDIAPRYRRDIDDFDGSEITSNQQSEGFLCDRIPIRRRVKKFWNGKNIPSLEPRRRGATATQRRQSDIVPQPPPVSSVPSHLFPHPEDVFFRSRQLQSCLFPSNIPFHMNFSHSDTSPLVLGWLQVPPATSKRFRNNTFRKAPWLQNLHLLHR